MALPLDVTRMVACTDMPITLPCQEPARVFSFSKAFCASDWTLAVFGIGMGISCADTKVAAASIIRIVSFRIRSPFQFQLLVRVNYPSGKPMNMTRRIKDMTVGCKEPATDA